MQAFGVEESSAATAAWRIERRSSSTRTVRSAAHGATTRPRCRTSTSCFAPRRLCSARRRALPRGRRGGDVAGRPARALALPLRRRARPRRGVARRPPADRSTTTGSSAISSSTGARRGATRTRFRPEAKPQPNFAGWPYGILFWPLERALGLVAGWNVLQILFYVLAGLAACAWLRELDLPRGARARGRVGVRDRAVPGRAERRPPARADLDSDPALAVGLRARPARKQLVARRRGRRARVDPAFRTGASRARCDPVLRRVRALPDPRPALLLGAVGGACRGRRRCARAPGDQRSTQAGGRSLDEISSRPAATSSRGSACQIAE